MTKHQIKYNYKIENKKKLNKKQENFSSNFYIDSNLVKSASNFTNNFFTIGIIFTITFVIGIICIIGFIILILYLTKTGPFKNKKLPPNSTSKPNPPGPLPSGNS